MNRDTEPYEVDILVRIWNKEDKYKVVLNRKMTAEGTLDSLVNFKVGKAVQSMYEWAVEDAAVLVEEERAKKTYDNREDDKD